MQFGSVGTVMHELNNAEAAPLANLLHGAAPRPTRSVMVEQRGAAIGLPPGQDGAYLLSCPGRQGTVWKVGATE